MKPIFYILGFFVLLAVLRVVVVAVFAFAAEWIPKVLSGLSDLLAAFSNLSGRDAPKVVAPPPLPPSAAGHGQADPPAPQVSPAPRMTARKLELDVAMGPKVGIAQCLLLKVRGGPVLADSLKVVYVVTASYMEKGRAFDVGDAASFTDPPRAFRGVYLSPTDPAKSDDWVLLKLLDLDGLLPPRRGFQTYLFSFHVYLLDQAVALDAPRPVGNLLETAVDQVNLNFGVPGYLDEKEWEEPRRAGIALLTSLLQGCTEELAAKHQKVKAWVNGIDLVGASPARKQVILGRRLSQYHSSQTLGIRLSAGQHDRLVDELASNQDYDLQRELAFLVVRLADAEPTDADSRHVLQTIIDSFSAAIYGLKASDFQPKPPLSVTPVTPVAPVTPARPKLTSFELKIEPYIENAVVKGVEVFVQGGCVAGSGVGHKLDFWLWDNSLDEPFLVAAPDIDGVHLRAVHQATWQTGKYDSRVWQSAGLIRFNEALPPRGGRKALVVAGRLDALTSVSSGTSGMTTRSEPLLMNIGSAGYQKMRESRLELRREALVLAFGLALISGKSPTFMQEKALKSFAAQLCSGLVDQEYADSCRETFAALLESTTVSDFGHLSKMLEAFARKAPPELKSQLHDVFVKIIAARKVRSKESRALLQYSAQVLAS